MRVLVTGGAGRLGVNVCNALERDGFRVRVFDLDNDRNRKSIKELGELEKISMPPDLDYLEVGGLSTEVRQKLLKHKPQNLKQARAIPGVTPASINAISIYLSLQKKKKKTGN